MKRLKGLSRASFSLQITTESDQGFYLHFSHSVLFWKPTHTTTPIYSTMIQQSQNLVPCDPESVCFPGNRHRRHRKSALSHNGSLQPLIWKHFQCPQPVISTYININQTELATLKKENIDFPPEFCAVRIRALLVWKKLMTTPNLLKKKKITVIFLIFKLTGLLCHLQKNVRHYLRWRYLNAWGS